MTIPTAINDEFSQLMDEYFRLHPITDDELVDRDVIKPLRPPPHPSSSSRKRKRDDVDEEVSITHTSMNFIFT
jgi:hypothetical protein